MKVKAEGMAEGLSLTIKAEEETGLKQLLVIDLDKGEWACYPIDEQLKEKIPALTKILQLFEKRDYVV